MQLLALEPFYGGSHKVFLDAWLPHSRHEFELLSLPDRRWKWRMRHAPLTFAQQLRESELPPEKLDVLWCCDMLNLPEFLGLAPSALRQLPSVVYFHENQLTYPVQEEAERDLHFAYTNFTTCCAADAVWFNSQFHQDEFLTALRKYLRRMPDNRLLPNVDEIEAKSSVHYPSIIRPIANRSIEKTGPLRIGWTGRWEFDKNPGDFFIALRNLKEQGVAFQLIVLGQEYSRSPQVFQTAKLEFAEEILHWGFAESKADYAAWLHEIDVVVSTANHEFFGIGVLEAMCCGAVPCLPNRLAYPEVIELSLGKVVGELPVEPLYDGSVKGLIQSLRTMASKVDLVRKVSRSVAAAVERNTVKTDRFDDALEQVVQK